MLIFLSFQLFVYLAEEGVYFIVIIIESAFKRKYNISRKVSTKISLVYMLYYNFPRHKRKEPVAKNCGNSNMDLRLTL